LPVLQIEHVAVNVREPVAVAAWYVEHLGMRVARLVPGPTLTHFLADAAGATVLEIYNNPGDAVPDYGAMHPLRLHVAFASADPAADADALCAAGATRFEEVHAPDGSHLVMLRDPWGLALQLCRRTVPLLGPSPTA
jgi:catechol 2,3-dioxygenase-like lactoylglutathione lyase family enzyme